MKLSLLIKSLAILSVSAVPLVLGCSADNGLNLARVRGKVTFRGEPVKKGTVYFSPDESKGTVGPSGMGGVTDGAYVASTDTAGDGVIVGTHKVGLAGVEAASEADVAAAAAETKTSAEFYQAKGAMGKRSGSSRGVDLFTDAKGN